VTSLSLFVCVCVGVFNLGFVCVFCFCRIFVDFVFAVE